MSSVVLRIDARRALLLAAIVVLCLVVAGPTHAADAEPVVIRELVELRTTYSTTYLLSDGSLRTVLSQEPVHVQDASGAWLPIDTTLVPVGGIESYTTAAAPVTVTVSDEAAGQKPVSLAAGDYLITLNLIGFLEDDKLVLGDSATYLAVAPDTDVTYTPTGDGLKEVVTLASPAAPNAFSYRVTHAGLILRQGEGGQWGFYAEGAERPSFLLGAMNACDSSADEAGEPAWCDAAQMSVTPGDDASTITFRVPRAWLCDAARVWPVRIDPSLFTRAPTDTYVSEGYPNTAYGSSADLLCGTVSTQTGDCKALLKFPQIDNTANIPAGSHISAATFSIRQYWQPASPHNLTHVYRVGTGSTNGGEATSWNTLTLADSAEISADSFTPSGATWLNVACPGVVQGFYSHSRYWDCTAFWGALTEYAYDGNRFEMKGSRAYMGVEDHSAYYVDSSKGAKWTIPTDEDEHSFIHIRAYGRYHGDDNFYIHRPATATRSQLRYVPATCHLDVNENHRWEYLGDIGIQLPSVSIGAKRGAYDGNAENAQKRIRRMWRAWGFSFGSRANLHNDVHGFRTINRDSYTVYGETRKSVMFRWHRSDGWATTLRM